MPTQPSEILIGRLVSERLEIRVGDHFPLFPEKILGIEEYDVVGIFETELSWENLGVVADARIVQEKMGGGDHFSLVFLYASADRVDEIRRAIDADFPKLIATKAGEFTDRFSDQMAYIDDFILVLQLIAAIVGVLGVLNTMMMSVTERVREIGTLRALGWPRRRVVGVIVAEGLLISLLGGVLGLVFGVLGTEVLIVTVSDGLLIADYLSSTFVRGMTLAVVVGLFGSLYPAMRASRLRPAEALRYE
jgi:putative ABC transport system permease protein